MYLSSKIDRYENCLPVLAEKYTQRPEDAKSWWCWWSAESTKPHRSSGSYYDYYVKWRVVAQEHVQFVRRGSGLSGWEEKRLLFLLVGEDVTKETESSFRAAVPSPLIANTVGEQNFLVGAEGS